jgi:hypothetical protein
MVASSSYLYTLLNARLVKYNVSTTEMVWEIEEDVCCFCISPDETECMLATKKNSLLHYK